MRIVELENCTLYHADCRDVLPILSGVDAVVTDPPYIMGIERVPIHGNRQTFSDSRSIGMAWDFSLDWIEHAAKLNPKHWVIYAGYKDVGLVQVEAEKYATTQTLFTWRKSNAPNMTRPIPRMDCEFILWLRTKDSTCGEMGKFRSMVLDIPMAYAGIGGGERVRKWENGPASHPCQKPCAVVLPFCERLPVETICDPFMGSGTTGVACIRAGRRFIGIEKDDKHFETAVKRITEELSQLRLAL